jgi:cytochrome c peroxidase
MNKKIPVILSLILMLVFLSFRDGRDAETYNTLYTNKLKDFKNRQQALLDLVDNSQLDSEADIAGIRKMIGQARKDMKAVDFWLRYLEPTVYKQVNGPLPVEWETEVFEKFEKPYKREGAGLSLAYLYLEEEQPQKQELQRLVKAGLQAMDTYEADSITSVLKNYHHFYLSNRLYILNLAAIYTTGFECPDTAAIIPELQVMVHAVHQIYTAFNETFPATSLTNDYMSLYKRMELFVDSQAYYSHFNHFVFIRDYVNPMFSLNQQMIRQYKVMSKSFVDYAMSKTSTSIFDKSLYTGQNGKGIFLRVTDTAALSEIDRLGKLLFYDPIISGNNERSCASCHVPGAYFTDTIGKTSLQFNHQGFLARNTPSLVNVGFNHLLMLDGKHISLQHQVRDVISNAEEMGSDEKLCLQKIMSCKDYKKSFNRLLKYTPQETEVTFEHVISAITMYYSKFSQYYSSFDGAMDHGKYLMPDAKEGFNLFMGKAQCATCHFVPNFNGVKPPYVGSEFEVLGVPADTLYKALSPDKGRYMVNPATETLNAFRTGSLRNISGTGPYMHNGVFKTLDQVIEFYNTGGGAGHGLKVDNQTLSSDSLGLTVPEKKKLIVFLKSLDEEIIIDKAPQALPVSSDKILNRRRVGGVY